MMGEITAGFCLREWDLYYGDKPAGPREKPCPIPLSDGKICGDTSCEGQRCAYSSKLKVDMEGQKYLTYSYLNDRQKSPGVMATGSTGHKNA